MKIAIATLNRYLKKPRTTDEIVALMARTEIEVEEVIRSDALDAKIILVKTTEVEPHPNADRLRLVTVKNGSEKIRVVCGAPNVTVGQRVALVQTGAKLPDGTKIGTSKIRGEVSHGMLASAQELGLSDDHSGIHVFEEDQHKLGTSLCDIVFSGDVLDIKTPANRWDYLSGVGIARELAAYDEGQGVVEPEVGEYTYKNTESVNVKVRGENQRFVSAKLRVKNDVKSPAWLVDNLAANGIATHNPVVDITNFVMLETGQPSHAYDATALTGPLEVRYAKTHEKITTLDDEVRELTEHDLVVCDASGPIGLAGVMGGATTQIRPETTEIVLEAAHWDKACVRKTAMRHGLRTEASARFERALPLPLPKKTFSRLLDLLKEICDAEIIDGPYDQLYGWPWQQFLGIRIRRAERFLGVKIDEKQVIKGLHSLGFGVEHFSITKELKSHVGKPYRWGANYRTDGEEAFDCSYLVDRIYSKLGIFVGHTALGQFHTGRSVETHELKPGDVLFYEGKIEKSVTDHYYLMNPDGTKTRYDLEQPEKVGHNGIYLGGGQVVQAAQYKYQQGEWVKRDEGGVIISPVEEFIENPGYLGARRYIESFNHILAVEVPWWRSDVRLEADMYEEIAKILGYDQMPETLPAIAPMSDTAQSLLVPMRELRRYLKHIGGTDVATYSFISETDAARTKLTVEQLPTVSNPRSPEQKYLRSDLLPSHLTMWQKNSVYRIGQVAFELSRVFSNNGKNGELPDETWVLALSSQGAGSLERLQAYVHQLLSGLHLAPHMESEQRADLRLVPQRSAKLVLGDKELGVFGQVSTPIWKAFHLSQPVSYAVFDVQTLLEAQSTPRVKSLPDYQLVQRDVSLELDKLASWQSIVQAISEYEKLVSWEYLSQYSNAELDAANRKVVTVRARFDMGAQPSASEIATVESQLIEVLQKKCPQAQLKLRV
jgi:phenylalanyl-tRNA synthetase beta subunit